MIRRSLWLQPASVVSFCFSGSAACGLGQESWNQVPVVDLEVEDGEAGQPRDTVGSAPSVSQTAVEGTVASAPADAETGAECTVASAPAVAETAVECTGSEDKSVAEPAVECTDGEVKAVAEPTVECTGGEDKTVAVLAEDKAVASPAVEVTGGGAEAANAQGNAGGGVSAALGLSPALDPPRLVCEKCRFPVDPLSSGVRMSKKMPQLWMCSSCNVKMVMMCRTVGGFLEEFKGGSEEDQRRFWQLRGSLKEYKAKFFHSYISVHI